MGAPGQRELRGSRQSEQMTKPNQSKPHAQSTIKPKLEIKKIAHQPQNQKAKGNSNPNLVQNPIVSDPKPEQPARQQEKIRQANVLEIEHVKPVRQAEPEVRQTDAREQKSQVQKPQAQKPHEQKPEIRPRGKIGKKFLSRDMELAMLGQVLSKHQESQTKKTDNIKRKEKKVAEVEAKRDARRKQKDQKKVVLCILFCECVSHKRARSSFRVSHNQEELMKVAEQRLAEKSLRQKPQK
eukprot:c9686_g1_i2.p1 GENE.c9686_g1_i2~~c9686_g1_i2.p1  ORF type:complete len:239 (+),score=47.71 c9686_g1_i2:1-717(+)